MPETRISIPIPAELVKQMDREAKRQNRSRSSLVADAVREYLRSATPGRHRAGLGPQRLAQLRADLGLTPEQRVTEAERTARATRPATFGRVSRAISFERYEDYLAYKARQDAD